MSGYGTGRRGESERAKGANEWDEGHEVRFAPLPTTNDGCFGNKKQKNDKRKKTTKCRQGLKNESKKGQETKKKREDLERMGGSLCGVSWDAGCEETVRSY